MVVKIKKTHPNSVVPVYAKTGDAGLDLTAVSLEFDYVAGKVTYDTGLAIEIPEGYVGLVFPRSSISKKKLALTNSVGVIDSGYRGSIKAVFKMESQLLPPEDLYKPGDRVAQIIIIPYPQIEFEEVDELSDSDRKAGGFGSTGS